MRGLGPVIRRLKRDLTSFDRTTLYREILASARDHGLPLIPLAESITLPADAKFVALRHDVDLNNVGGNVAFHAIEKSLGARSTFYFRLHTFHRHRRLIAQLRDDGFEVGYHFEEPATFAIRHGVKSAADLLRHDAAIRAEIRSNVDWVRRNYNSDLVSLCAHGDWINRKLAIASHRFVDDGLLAEIGLKFEACHLSATSHATYVSDVIARPGQTWSLDLSPAQAFADAPGPIHMLTHEASWLSDRLARAAENMRRISQGLTYEVTRRAPARLAYTAK